MSHPSDVMARAQTLMAQLTDPQYSMVRVGNGVQLNEEEAARVHTFVRAASGAYEAHDLARPDLHPEERAAYGDQFFDCEECESQCAVTYAPELRLCVTCMFQFLMPDEYGYELCYNPMSGLAGILSFQPATKVLHVVRMPTLDRPETPPQLTIVEGSMLSLVWAYDGSYRYDLIGMSGDYESYRATQQRNQSGLRPYDSLPVITATLDRLIPS